ncbi:MAG: SDR family oxidoreductase [Leptolyngbya sp. UWPOB_LEPTO1]|uniref:SDR family oxidoreductase n=1 Tax=Leptolyngbya sp. UWPOB_LEPTO1 TaxID=2815653 RepID=UPI001AC75115|nr:SDR family oxidoreductase [Leptolyngbya sp. UWPOB_LEPTO1]MBN8561331.1 SDR family oxidoreductase [Leptolyngbya sp. UWPOB_LEPTO1]
MLESLTPFQTVLVAGASRGVGREIARILQPNFTVKALLRSNTAVTELEALGIQPIRGDAMIPEQLDLSGIDAVISTIGGLPGDIKRADDEGNRNLIDAARKAGVKKFVLVTSIGCGDSVVALPPRALEALGAVLADKEKAEQYLIDSGLTYTIVRPGGLKSEPATGTGFLTEDPKISGSIHRADVAGLVCKCLISDRANQKILSALDRNQMFSASEIVEFIP